MEKQVNKFNHNLMQFKTIKYIILFVLLSPSLSSIAQDRIPFDKGKPYILANIEVTGKLNFNEQTVVTFSGLEKGQRIIVPGEEITAAIKKLGKLELFSDIDMYITKIEGDSIYLELNLVELPKLNDVKFLNVKKGKLETLVKETGLKKGKIVNENLITTTKNYLENKYKKDGFYKTKININVIPDTTASNEVKMVVGIDKGNKVKINKIEIEGNNFISDKKIRRAMKGTKVQLPGRFWKGSKYIQDKYKEDLVNIVNKYKEKGYRDARVVWDSIKYNKEINKIGIKLKIEEGRKYYFGDIKFFGNSIYTDEGLARVLGLNKGDVYNGVLLNKRINDKTKPDANDITNLYQNNGYLFSNVNAVEVRTENDTIDFEIRIMEGPLAYFNKITVVGNDKTNDKVIYRELRTKPGQKYSKEDLVRSIREIGQLGFFDAENIDPKFKNVDPSAGTVDIEYNIVEKGASQIELQGGYGGGGFIGTLGLSFNNFSMSNIFKKNEYKPLPMGDGQVMSLRLQGSTFFQTYSLNFTEPWLGGKKPIQLNTSFSYSKQFLFTGGGMGFGGGLGGGFGGGFGGGAGIDRDKSFNIASVSVGIAQRLTVPDDYFVLSQAVSFQFYDLNNYNTNLFTFGDGSARNLAYTVALTRNNKGTNPIYPTYGSEFSITAKLTPPYSAMNGVDYGNLENLEEYKYRYQGEVGYFDSAGNFVAPGDLLTAVPSQANPEPNKATGFEDAAVDQGKVDQEKFKWLEFYKIKFKADVYTKVYEKLVLRSLGEFAFLGAYNNERGLVPFERFFLGGDGLANFALDGREIIQLRGYPNQSLSDLDGGAIYNKFSLELRYPVTLNNSATIYALTFIDAGASYNNFKEYNPFKLYRSAGFGLRVFMPAFGLLGIDFGHGFDALPGQSTKNGWETHFIIGQQF